MFKKKTLTLLCLVALVGLYLQSQNLKGPHLLTGATQTYYFSADAEDDLCLWFEGLKPPDLVTCQLSVLNETGTYTPVATAAAGRFLEGYAPFANFSLCPYQDYKLDLQLSQNEEMAQQLDAPHKNYRFVNIIME